MDDVDIAADLEWYRRKFSRFGRYVAVAALYMIALIVLGGFVWKSLLAFVVLIILQMLSLGTRRIAQLGVLLFLIAGVYWVEIMPLHRWSKLAGDKIEMYLAASPAR